MVRCSWLLMVVLFMSRPVTAHATSITRNLLQRRNQELHGHVVDYTNNHGADRRIWSCALRQKRDLYVYLPPGFDPCKRYPILINLHGLAQDEQYFLRHQVALFDKAIAQGQVPPLIIAAPDGSLRGRPSFYYSHSFFINSKAGRYEDFVMHDVWNFLHAHYPIRPEREAHVIGGVSFGGGAAFHLAMKYKHRFKTVIGYFPAVNLRWVDCHHRYRGNFDPCCWGWRQRISLCEPVGRFYCVFVVRYRHFINPLLGGSKDMIQEIRKVNPIETLDSYDIRPGELNMFIAYGGRDEFNIDAHVESFLYRARQRGLCVAVAHDPKGRHNLKTGTRLFGYGVRWLGSRLAPYGPVPCHVTKSWP